jgi:hypothetical protein
MFFPVSDAAGVYTICPAHSHGARPTAQSNAGTKRGPGAGTEKLTPPGDDSDTVDLAAVCSGTVVHTAVVVEGTVAWCSSAQRQVVPAVRVVPVDKRVAERANVAHGTALEP